MNLFSREPINDHDSNIALMKHVERIVRPVKASVRRKRKMREELLAHLSAIFYEELARSGDPTAAVNTATERFGDPAELTAELQATAPRLERFEYQLESWLGWHPPETALRWMSRAALQLGAFMTALCALVAIVAMREFSWSYSLWLTVRPLTAAALVLPVTLFSYGVCYYKIRDHLLGVFGSQKSWSKVVYWAGLLNFTTVASGFTFFTISYGRLAVAAAAFYPIVVFGVIWAAGAIVIARAMGPQEIRDTSWALLDLDDQPIAID